MDVKKENWAFKNHFPVIIISKFTIKGNLQTNLKGSNSYADLLAEKCVNPSFYALYQSRDRMVHSEIFIYQEKTFVLFACFKLTFTTEDSFVLISCKEKEVRE